MGAQAPATTAATSPAALKTQARPLPVGTSARLLGLGLPPPGLAERALPWPREVLQAPAEALTLQGQEVTRLNRFLIEKKLFYKMNFQHLAQTSRSNCQPLDKWLWDLRTGDLTLAASDLMVGSQRGLCVARARGVDGFLCFSSPQPSCCPSHAARLLIRPCTGHGQLGRTSCFLLPGFQVGGSSGQAEMGKQSLGPGAPPCHGVRESSSLLWGISGQSICLIRAVLLGLILVL